jgi:DNA-binding CsgD family transcriptional regulator
MGPAKSKPGPVPPDGDASVPVRLRGRDVEVDDIVQKIDGLENGRGAVIIVSGGAGVGKSALIGEAEDLARDRGIRVFRGAGDAALQTVPLGPLLEALVVTDDPPVVADALRELSGSPDQRFWLLRELQERLEHAALLWPMVIAIDDIQWADVATLSALRTLPRHLASHRILWLFAIRSGELLSAAAAAVTRLEEAGALNLPLDRLDDSAVAEIAADVLGGAPNDALLRALHGVHGHPFLLVELLRGLRDDSLVDVNQGVASLNGTEVPVRFLDTVGEQLARLSHTSHDVLQMASVLGRRFSVEELAAMVEQPPVALMGTLREAIAAGLIVEDDRWLGFGHELVREAVDAGLPDAIRRALQRRALEVMIEHGALPGDVATLVMQVAQPGDLSAIELLRRAAAEVGRVSPAVAAPLSRRALDLTPAGDPSRGARVVETLGFLVHAGQAADADNLIAATSEDPIDHVAEGEARVRIGLLMLQYLPSETVEQCRQGLLLPDLPASLRIQLLSLMSRGFYLLGDVASAEAPSQEATALSGVTGDSVDEIISLLPRAIIAYARGDWSNALDLARTALGKQRTAKMPTLRLWRTDAWTALLLIGVARLEEAFALIDAGTRAAQEEGVSANVRVWSMVRCRALFCSGRLDDARAEAEALLELSDEYGAGRRGYINQIASYILASVALHTGDPSGVHEATDAASEMQELPTDAAGKRLGAWLAARLADFHDLVDRAEQLDAKTLDPLVTTYLPVGSPLLHADAAVAVRMLLRVDKRSNAEVVVKRIEQAVALHPDFPFLQAAAIHARALFESDAELALRAVELYREDRRPLIRASALEDAGRLLPAEQRKEAVSHLDAALEIYSAAGADRDCSRVRGLLRARGVRRLEGGKRTSSEWPDLTESEFAVVRLAADGATNREVAERLYISPYTVNSHLRHVFTKLGIRSRVELARLVAERESRKRRDID